jgi:hypothetical protein
MDGSQRMPKGLRRLIGMPTYADKLRMFQVVHDRDPESEEELESFIIDIARQLYNAEQDEWPEDDEWLV